MLKKLLKYDFKFLFKYWWIGAIICLSLSVAGGFCIRLLDTSFNERELPAVVDTSASSVLFLTFIAFIAFVVITFILIFIRFYTNLFSDEGYLTFTLPVKRTSLLNSKIITAVLTQIATSALIAACIGLMLIIGLWEDFWSAKFWNGLIEIIKLYFGDNVLCRIIYIIEVLALSVLSVVFGNLFLFICITFASIITRKARVITAIGIYLGIYMAISFSFQIFFLFGITTIASYFQKISANMLEPVICLAGLGVVLLFSILCVSLYTLMYRMLDRKLNLA